MTDQLRIYINATNRTWRAGGEPAPMNDPEPWTLVATIPLAEPVWEAIRTAEIAPTDTTETTEK